MESETIANTSAGKTLAPTPAIGAPPEGIFGPTNATELKQKSVRGGAIALVSQGVKFVLRTGAMVVLARLLSPEDFGLQGMVLAVTGFLGMFRDAGLSIATIQRSEITHQQISTLFWVNLGVGIILAGLAAALAPSLVAFYNEPRLFWITVLFGMTFLFYGVGAQHQALLQRRMDYVTMALIEVIALVVSSGVGIAMAVLGYGYWALVGMGVTAPLVSTVGSWLAVPWIPGLPTQGSGVRSMLHFGGTCTCNALVVYVAYNMEKILLGRFWGAEVLGLYGRAYQLINLPMEQLNSSINTIAFPAISRIQNDPERLCRSFLKGYSILFSLTFPVTILCAVFAEEIVSVMLGRKWMDAAPIFRLLTPTVIALALVNPFGWFMQATGRVVRSLKIALMIAPVVLTGILAGLHYGPKGVALGYSIAMTLLVVPIIAWAKHGTEITMRRYWSSIQPIILGGVVASICGLAIKLVLGKVLPALPLLAIELAVSSAIYAWFLLIVMKQKPLYMDILAQVFPRLRAARSPASV